MDVRPSADQRALRDSVAHLVERLRPESVHSLDDAERTAKLDAAVGAAGWRELRAADDSGAPWGTGVEVAIVAEELARGAADTAFLGPALAADLRRLAGAPAATASETVALTTDLSRPTVAAGSTLDQSAMAVDTGDATQALVLTLDNGLAQVALDGSLTDVDLTRRMATVAAGTRVTPVAGPGSVSRDDLTRWTALGLAGTCADLVGAMRGAVRLARDHATTRKQYGVPIGSFQAVQHLLADAHVATEGSASIALHAAWAVDALAPAEALAAGAAAKAYCAHAAREVCEAAIQVHGGMGNTWECMAHIYLRRALVSTDLFGDAGVNLARVLDHWVHEPAVTGAGDGLR